MPLQLGPVADLGEIGPAAPAVTGRMGFMADSGGLAVLPVTGVGNWPGSVGVGAGWCDRADPGSLPDSRSSATTDR